MSIATVPLLDSAELKTHIDRFQQVHNGIVREVRKVIVGQEEVLDQVLIALFVGGHCLITGLPGTAKTLLVRTIAQTLGLVFKRIQFTPDLMPSDMTGTDIIEEDPGTGRRTWTFVPGPVFCNVLLADEINRTPPKTQSALLEAMQELSCTVRGHLYRIVAPFFVLATQNPIELEGTYPLPEAQLDRFLFNTVLDYLSADDEVKVVDLTTTTAVAHADTVTNADEILQFQQLVRMVPIADTVARYAVDLVRATRPNDPTAPEFVKKYVNFGASVRAAQFVVLAAKARALMRNRYHVSYDDIRTAGGADSAAPDSAQFPRGIRAAGFGRNPEEAAGSEAGAARVSEVVWGGSPTCPQIVRNSRLNGNSLHMEFYRRRLPHWHPEGASIFLTWRLHGSLPHRLAKRAGTDRERFAAMDQELDRASHGPTWLTNPAIADTVQQVLISAGQCWDLYELFAWVIMSNHVHALLKPKKCVPEVTRAIKSNSARKANEILGRSGAFWQDESYDHWVRSQEEFSRIVKYIERNPVRAGLIDRIEDWRWSSAFGQVGDLPHGVR